MIVIEDVVVDAGTRRQHDDAPNNDAQGNTLLNSVSLNVEEGDFVAIVGASGTGKSTLLRSIVGLTRIKSGNVRVNGNQLNSRTVNAVRRDIAYIDQEPVLGADELVVREALLRPFALHANRHFRPGDAQLRAALDHVGLDESILSKTLSVISGGEKQRLSIVRASLLRRPILLADEPTSALDASHRRIVADFLREMADAALVATHDVDLIARATHVLRLENGRITQIDRDTALEGEREHGIQPAGDH